MELDSDESYETTSDAFVEDESETDSNTYHTDEYHNQSTHCSGLSERQGIEVGSKLRSYFTTSNNAAEIQYTYILKLKEQNQQIQAMKKERIGLLEQITNLCTSLELKESELMDFMQLYEKKVNGISQYMVEVQNLLVQLGALFPSQFTDCNLSSDHISKQSSSDDISKSTLNSTQWNENTEANNQIFDTLTKRDQRGRELLNALSESIATAVSATSTSTNDQIVFNDQMSVSTKTIQASINSTKHLEKSDICAESTPVLTLADHLNSSVDKIHLTVQRLPAFCWNPDHVIYWLSEYVCLPGGCLDAAKRIRLDGKQLTNVIDNKKEKLLCLNDAGLRRKFRLAVEDLRVHGSPGISRNPGPSHIDTDWICDIWLPIHLGLTQLVPYFSIRRIDGRLLSSLIHYKSVKSSASIYQHNRRSGPVLSISNPCENPNLCNDSIAAVNDRFSTGGLSDVIKSDLTNQLNKYRVADRKEMLRILFGIGRESTVGSVSGNHNSSGAELPLLCKFILGKRETVSLQTAIELLHKHNYNIKSLDQIRSKQRPPELDVLYWTNSHVKKWLIDIGLKDYTHGIDASGLHGAYMVLDAAFDVSRLIKHIRVPTTVANNCKLDEQLQSILLPARQREGVCAKSHSIFRRRSVQKSIGSNLMQQSMLCNSSSPNPSSNANSIPITSTPYTLLGDTNLYESSESHKQNPSLIWTGHYFRSSLSNVYTPQCEKRKAQNTLSECHSVLSSSSLTNGNHFTTTTTATTTTTVTPSSCSTRAFQRNRSTGLIAVKSIDPNKADTVSLTSIKSTRNCGTVDRFFDCPIGDEESRSNTLVRKYSKNSNQMI